MTLDATTIRRFKHIEKLMSDWGFVLSVDNYNPDKFRIDREGGLVRYLADIDACYDWLDGWRTCSYIGHTRPINGKS